MISQRYHTPPINTPKAQHKKNKSPTISSQKNGRNTNKPKQKSTTGVWSMSVFLIYANAILWSDLTIEEWQSSKENLQLIALNELILNILNKIKKIFYHPRLRHIFMWKEYPCIFICWRLTIIKGSFFFCFFRSFIWLKGRTKDRFNLILAGKRWFIWLLDNPATWLI